LGDHQHKSQESSLGKGKDEVLGDFEKAHVNSLAKSYVALWRWKIGQFDVSRLANSIFDVSDNVLCLQWVSMGQEPPRALPRKEKRKKSEQKKKEKEIWEQILQARTASGQ
jgi:hypothetical protein